MEFLFIHKNIAMNIGLGSHWNWNDRLKESERERQKQSRQKDMTKMIDSFKLFP